MADSRRGSGGGGGVLATLFRYEIKMLLRDKRTLAIAVLAPLVVLPGALWVMSWVEEREEERQEATTLEYAVTGSRAEWGRGLVREALALAESGVDTLRDRSPIAEREVADADSLLGAGELHLVVEALTPEEWDDIRARRRAEGGSEASGDDEADGADGVDGGPELDPAPDLDPLDDLDPEDRADEAASGESGTAATDSARVPVLRLHYRSNSELSSTARRRVQAALQDLRSARQDSLFLAAGFPVDPAQVATVELDNQATAEEETGVIIGLALTPFLVMLMLTGGSLVAADAISGEKERGTLETLLTTAARRWEIVASKQLAIVAVGVTITVINVANLLVYLVIGVFDLPDDFAVSVEPVGLVLLLLLFVPLALMISSTLLMVSGYSKSYKEYQVYFFPVFLLFLIPSFASVLPGIELSSAIALIPVANVAVAAKEILTAEYNWLALAVTIAVTAGVAAWMARMTSKSLSTERLITAAELDRADLAGGPALFPRHVLRWFAVMWAALLMVSVWFGEDLGIRGQVAVNLGGIFLGGTLLMLYRYRLDVREALALRPVKPAVWLAVLIGAPSGLLSGILVFRLADLLFPVPEQMLESFGQFLLPEALPLWQVVLFLAVAPGIIEEMAFRGVLLHGLRRRFHPVVLCLVVGGIFGLFHVSLFRLVPTAYLGVIFAAVTLLTGSIFPAMAWHAINNAAALVPEHQGWFSLQTESLTLGLVGLAGLAVSFWILWRTRTPYPGLKGSRPGGGSGYGGGGRAVTAGAPDDPGAGGSRPR